MAAYQLFSDELIGVYDPVVFLANDVAYIVVNPDGITYTAFIGEGITYDPITGRPNGGVISRVNVGNNVDGGVLYAISDVHVSMADVAALVDEILILRDAITWTGLIGADPDATIGATEIDIANTDGSFTRLTGAFATVNGEPTGTVDEIAHIASDGVTVLAGPIVYAPPISLDLAAAILLESSASELIYDLLSTGDNVLTGVDNIDVASNQYVFQLLDLGGSDILIGAIPGMSADFSLSGDAIFYIGAIGVVAHAGGDVDQLVNIYNVFGSEFDDGLDGSAIAFTNQILVGNGGNDIIRGGALNDLLNGGAGDDTLDGGAGFDIADYRDLDAPTEVSPGLFYGAYIDLRFIASQDTVSFGSDTLTNIEGVYGSGFNDIIFGSDVDNSLWGEDGDDLLVGLLGTDLLYGGGGADVLQGHDGDDTLDGGAGADDLDGGSGNDVYFVDHLGDTLYEVLGDGLDEARISATYTLAAGVYVERLVASAASITITGNALNNTLVGNGSSTLQGGLGADLYIVSSVGDTLTEAPGGGVDRVEASFTYTLADNIEALTLTGAVAINGTGNNGDNLIIGNSVNNTLTGAQGNDTLIGGLGVDAMFGGLGNDIFHIQNVGDTANENAGEGNDTVNSLITYVLPAHIERLVLNGAAAINGTGNALANTITGNGANNSLFGLAGADTLSGGAGNDILDGGAGIDAMMGGAGNDTYFVDNIADSPTENANGGVDMIFASVNYVMGAHLENITLTGAAAAFVTGNFSNNVMAGNGAANALNGGFGADTLLGKGGNDTLTGGAGPDVFVFDTAPNALTNRDTIADFVVVDDTIRLENAIFSAFVAAGAIAAGNLRAGAGFTTAADANDFLIYNTTNGQLRYDPDGNGAAGAIHFATLNAAPAVTAADFVIV